MMSCRQSFSFSGSFFSSAEIFRTVTIMVLFPQFLHQCLHDLALVYQHYVDTESKVCMLSCWELLGLSFSRYLHILNCCCWNTGELPEKIEKCFMEYFQLKETPRSDFTAVYLKGFVKEVRATHFREVLTDSSWR